MTRLHGLMIGVAAMATAFATSAQSITSPGTTDGNPPVSAPQSVQAGTDAGFLNATQTQNLLSQIAQSFIPGFTPSSPGTTASLISGTPATQAIAGKYAVVSDLYGGTNEVLRAGYTAGIGAYWRPQRTDYGASLTSAGGTLTLVPLQTAPYVYLQGQLASSLTINLSAVNAWPGATFCVANNLTLGLFTVNLSGVGLPSTNMLAGASKCAVYDGTAWRPF